MHAGVRRWALGTSDKLLVPESDRPLSNATGGGGTFVGRLPFLRDELDEPVIKVRLSLRVLYQAIVSKLKTHLFYFGHVWAGTPGRRREKKFDLRVHFLLTHSWQCHPTRGPSPCHWQLAECLALPGPPCPSEAPALAAGFSSREVWFSAQRASPMGSQVLAVWTLPFVPPIYKRSSCFHSSYPCSIFAITILQQHSNQFLMLNFPCWNAWCGFCPAVWILTKMEQ